MNSTVLLDTGPLGLAANPGRSKSAVACAQWLQSLTNFGIRVLEPEIADFEVRRELLRAEKTTSIHRLDYLADWLEYLPITTAAMRHAAEFWAQARRQGKPTAPDQALDAHVILAGQAEALGVADSVIATTNVDHLSRFVSAAFWSDIKTT